MNIGNGWLAGVHAMYFEEFNGIELGENNAIK